MKKVLLFTLGILLFISELQANTIPRVEKPSAEKTGPILKINIHLGRIKKGCTGFGLCDVKVSIDWSSTPVEGEETGSGSAWMENGKLNIALDRSTMSATTLNTYFDGGTFRMEEDYELPEEAATALGIKAYTIRTGNYAIQRSGADGATLKITF